MLGSENLSTQQFDVSKGIAPQRSLSCALSNIKTQIMEDEINECLKIAREQAKAERSLKIEHWLIITIERRTPDNKRSMLRRYDLPREMLERYRWVIRWRTARLQCLYPRDWVTTAYRFYDKRTGLKTGFNSCLIKLAAAKAQITRAINLEKKYIAEQKSRYPMFYDEAADPDLAHFREKIRNKRRHYLLSLVKLRRIVWDHKVKLSNREDTPRDHLSIKNLTR